MGGRVSKAKSEKNQEKHRKAKVKRQNRDLKRPLLYQVIIPVEPDPDQSQLRNPKPSDARIEEHRPSESPIQAPTGQKAPMHFQRRVHRPMQLGSRHYISQRPGGQERFKSSGRHSHVQYRVPPQLVRPPPSTYGTLPATQNPVKRASPNLYKEDKLSHIAFTQEGKVDLRATLHETGDRLVMVMFYENECEHCEAMRMIYEEFVIKYPEILFLEANVAYNERSIEALKIKFLPTFLVFRNHLEVGRVMTVDAEEVEEVIHLNLPKHLYEGTIRLTP